MIPHDGSMFSIAYKHVTCKITRIRPCATEIRHVEEKMCLLNFFIYTCQLSLFRPIIEH